MSKSVTSWQNINLTFTSFACIFSCLWKTAVDHVTISILRWYSSVLYRDRTKNDGERRKKETHILSVLCVGKKKKRKRQAMGGGIVRRRFFFSFCSLCCFIETQKRSLTVVGFEPTPQVTSTWNWRLRPLGHTVSIAQMKCLYFI